jgi:uncharacterized protein YbaP (TraB family)
MKTFKEKLRRQPRPGKAALCLLASGLLCGQPVFAEDDTALFWSVHRGGESAGYLLGTIHSEDPRVLDFSEDLIEKLGESRYFAMEMVPDLPTLKKLTEYMQYTDGTRLESVIGEERFTRLERALSSYQVPADWMAGMKVWAAMMTLSVPPPETGFFMDFSLSLRAAGAGLNVVGLESLEEQLSFLEDMPMDQQLALLDQALEDYGEVREIHARMVDHYLSGNLMELSALAREQLDDLPPEASRYFLEQGIDARNRRMLESLLPHFDGGRVFVGVGALHLPGESGLINLLRASGFELRPLAAPFSGAAPASARQSAPGQNN